jgi:hypothetical protein
MEEAAKETVIIVHGTFAGPKPEKRCWHQPGDGDPIGFIAKLNLALQKRGSAARCWAHCSQGDHGFHWSGKNSWVDREQAAAELADYVTKLQKEGWRCHIVAHSHGGNVLVDALPKITRAEASASLGNVVTLGTPFMDVTTPMLWEEQRRQVNLAGASLMIVVFVTLNLVRLFFREDYLLRLWSDIVSGLQSNRATLQAITLLTVLSMPILLFLGTAFRWLKLKGHFRKNWKALAAELLVWFIAGVTFHFIFYQNPSEPFNWFKLAVCGSAVVGLFIARRKFIDINRLAAVSIPQKQAQLRFLAMSSKKDEAWQLLRYLRNNDNPLAVKTTLFKYIASTIRFNFAHKAALDRIYFGSSSDIGRAAMFGATVVYFAIIALMGGLIAAWVWIPEELPLGFKFVFAVVLWAIIIILIPTMFFGNKMFIALLIPIRHCIRAVSVFTGVFSALGTYAVRRASWTIILKLATGLDGYRYDVPAIKQHPTNVHAEVENISAAVEIVALKNRSAWIERHIADASETFSKLTVTSDDRDELLRMIEADQTLVHAAYYTDGECVARIADWIAAKDDVPSNAIIAAEARGEA